MGNMNFSYRTISNWTIRRACSVEAFTCQRFFPGLLELFSCAFR